jgi:ribosomal protein L16 Arg81 hydroxylase
VDYVALRAILGDLPVERFLEESWPDRLVVAHGPLERLGEFTREPSLRSLAALVAAAHRSVRAFYRARDGRARQMVVDPATALQLYEDLGCSLCVTAGELGAVRPWVETLEAELGLPRASTTFNVYASPPGSGLFMHYDATRKVVVQVAGEKRWRAAPNVHVTNPAASFSNEALEAPEWYDGLAGPWPLAMPEGAQEFTLAPGSVLFLPRGWWHDTEAGGASLSVSITPNPPDHAQVIVGALLERLRRDPAWRASVVGPWSDGASRARAVGSVASCLERLRAIVNGLSAEELVPPGPSSDPLARVTRAVWARPVRRP